MSSALLIVFLLALSAPALSEPPRWIPDPKHQSLQFSAQYGEETISGAFRAFDAEIMLDPKAPQNGRIRVTIPMQSLTSEDEDALENLPLDVWLDSEAYPEAVFASEKITQQENGTYLAEGTLTLKGISAPLSLPFTLKLSTDGMHAEAEGSAQISRLAHKVGEGEWAATDLIKDSVTVRFALRATQQP